MKENKNIKKTIVGILIIIIGVFLLITMVAFKTEYSIYKAHTISEIRHHIFGIFGLYLASFIYRYLGFSSYVFVFSILHIGYLVLTDKKKVFIYLSIPFWIFEISLFCTIFSINKINNITRGGELGKFLFVNLFQMQEKIKLIKLITIFISIITIFGILYKPILKNVIQIVAKKIRRRDKSMRITKLKNQKESNKYVRKFFFKKDKKLPLIKKIYYYDGNIIGENRLEKRDSINEKIESNDDYEKNIKSLKENKIKRDFNGNIIETENENGQYILPVVSENKENIPIKSSSSNDSLNLPKLNGSILKKSKFFNKKEQERETQKKAKELERTLNEFGIEARVTGIIRGPVITRYEIQPAPGVKLNRIVNLSDNIALNLSAKGVRIEAPIPGRSAVGIEVPNEYREIVMLGDILDKADVKGELPLILGKDVSGKIVVSDLAEMPHLLIAGATGSGKSVCVNSLILSLLFKKSPENVKFIMIDPKMVELKIYNGIPHLLTEVVTDPRHAAKALRWVLFEMENRYKILDENKVRDIKGYNHKATKKMPYIIVIIDEFANLMAISQKDVEDAVVRLAAMSRAVGIHIIMATQRPSVDVITGLIKANFPYRIAFQVASKTDSRTILDTMGAEKLLGRGDMLFSPAGSMNLIRIQGAYVSEDEVISVVKELKKGGNVEYLDIFEYEEKGGVYNSNEDPIFDEAVDIVIKTRRASASFLQRRLKIGYNRAARLIEVMEERGIIGPLRGSKPREIFIDSVDKINDYPHKT